MYPFLLSTPFRPKKNVILDINLDKCLSRFIPRIVLFKMEVVGCKNCSRDFFETNIYSRRATDYINKEENLEWANNGFGGVMIENNTTEVPSWTSTIH